MGHGLLNNCKEPPNEADARANSCEYSMPLTTQLLFINQRSQFALNAHYH